MYTEITTCVSERFILIFRKGPSCNHCGESQNFFPKKYHGFHFDQVVFVAYLKSTEIADFKKCDGKDSGQ